MRIRRDAYHPPIVGLVVVYQHVPERSLRYCCLMVLRIVFQIRVRHACSRIKLASSLHIRVFVEPRIDGYQVRGSGVRVQNRWYRPSVPVPHKLLELLQSGHLFLPPSLLVVIGPETTVPVVEPVLLGVPDGRVAHTAPDPLDCEKEVDQEGVAESSNPW